MNNTINETLSQVSIQAPQILGMALPLTNSPAVDIFIITIFSSLFVTLINKFFSDQVAIKALRKDMKDLQKKARDAMKNDPKKAQQLQQQIMKKNLENMKHAMNPKIMLMTMLPMLLLFIFVKQYYGAFGNILDLGFTEFTWLGTYILFSIINSILLKKVLDVA